MTRPRLTGLCRVSIDVNDDNLRLSPHSLHLWLLWPDTVAPPLLQRYQMLLDVAETNRLQRLKPPQLRRQFLLARALVRSTLSRYRSEVSPRDWSFVANTHGKPRLVSPQGTGLSFNLSHTSGLLACAVTAGNTVGVDVEYTGRRNRVTEVAARFFSTRECRSLSRLSPEQQHDRFFTYWTLKESYIKARGLGLAIPLGRFSFELDAHPGQIRFELDPVLDDCAEHWQFWLWQPGPTHRLAACLQSVPAIRPEIRVWHTVPLGTAAPKPIAALPLATSLG